MHWLRAGEGIRWLAAGTMPNSLYRMPLAYLSLTFVFCYSCSFLFRLCVCVFLCSHWSLVDVPLIFFCPADHVPDWQPRVLLGMVEARSVNVKKTTTTTTGTTYNDGLLPDMILLTQCYYHRGTRLNAMKRFCLCSLWSHLNVLTFFPLTGGCSEGLDAFRFFFKQYNSTIYQKSWLRLLI